MFSRFSFGQAKARSIFRLVRFFYDSRTKQDTIFALSTTIQPVKGSPLGVIRISGSQTEQAVQQLTRHSLLRQESCSPNDQLPRQTDGKIILPRYATLTKITKPDTNELVDIGLVLWFPEPNSYTGEDVCELHVHGSRAIVTTILNTLGSFQGFRPAEPGEFTRRALINGKVSFLQAESLPDLIASQTDQQRRLALSGLDGSTRAKYDRWIESLVDILAHLEASIDFGEDELIGEKRVVENCIRKLNSLSEEIGRFIKMGSQCRDLIQGGVRVAILGKPNADLSGTTRDVVEHSFSLGGHAIVLCDTAGLRDLPPCSTGNLHRSKSLLERHDSVEREGIRRALEAAQKADLILYVVDGSELSGSETELFAIVAELKDMLRTIADANHSRKIVHLVINKIDLNDKLLDYSAERIVTILHQANDPNLAEVVSTTCISCTTQKNFDTFVSQLSARLDRFASAATSSLDFEDASGGERIPKLDYVNERHLSLLKSSQRHLKRASELQLDTIDEMAQHVRESVDYLSRIVGAVSNDQVIDIIFRDFCIGK